MILNALRAAFYEQWCTQQVIKKSCPSNVNYNDILMIKNFPLI